jgi:hypothetical protein
MFVIDPEPAVTASQGQHLDDDRMWDSGQAEERNDLFGGK